MKTFKMPKRIYYVADFPHQAPKRFDELVGVPSLAALKACEPCKGEPVYVYELVEVRTSGGEE